MRGTVLCCSTSTSCIRLITQGTVPMHNCQRQERSPRVPPHTPPHTLEKIHVLVEHLHTTQQHPQAGALGHVVSTCRYHCYYCYHRSHCSNCCKHHPGPRQCCQQAHLRHQCGSRPAPTRCPGAADCSAAGPRPVCCAWLRTCSCWHSPKRPRLTTRP